MTETYLIDTSALVRLLRFQVGAEWDQALGAGLIGVCEPVRLEYLRAKGGRRAYHESVSLLQDMFLHFVVPDSAWTEAGQLQRQLADRSWQQSASPVDLLVAVTAAHHKVSVLHADRDFDTIARITGQRVQWISSG